MATDGASVGVGGAGSSEAEPASSEDYVADRTWVDPPDEACWRDDHFDVHSADILEG